MWGGNEIDQRCGKLTDRQKVCLRLVGQNYSSKDVALSLGISPNTVDTRIKEAMAVLGVSRRATAARVLLSFEAQFPPTPIDARGHQNLVSQLNGLTPAKSPGQIDGPGWSVDRLHGESIDVRFDHQEQFFADKGPKGAPLTFWSIFAGDVIENRLSAKSRLLVVVSLMVAALAAFAMLVSAMEGLSRL